MEKLTIQIDGMSCGHCVSAVKQALAEVPGVTVEDVSIGHAVVSYEPAQTSTADITDALADVGYEASATP